MVFLRSFAFSLAASSVALVSGTLPNRDLKPNDGAGSGILIGGGRWTNLPLNGTGAAILKLLPTTGSDGTGGTASMRDASIGYAIDSVGSEYLRCGTEGGELTASEGLCLCARRRGLAGREAGGRETSVDRLGPRPRPKASPSEGARSKSKEA